MPCGEGGNAEACSGVERDAFRKDDGLRLREHDVLRSRPERPSPRGIPDPYPLSDALLGDASLFMRADEIAKRKDVP